MKALTGQILAVLTVVLTIFASPHALAADKVVLSLQQDLTDEAGLEASCVALQLGTGLLMSQKEKAKVTIFATLEGVHIADQAIYDTYPECETFNEDGQLVQAPLEDVLNGFLDAGGEILLCPLCYWVRQNDDPFDRIYPDDPRIYVASPIPLLLEANKIIDY